jgi:hypothetical protein
VGQEKCILFIDELNQLEDIIDGALASFLRRNFLNSSGRGLVFFSHAPSLIRTLCYLIPSPSVQVITHRLPNIPSLREAREMFEMPTLSAQETLFLLGVD